MSRLIMWNLVSLDGYFEGPEPDHTTDGAGPKGTV
jgi:hypothetical protein